MRRSDPGKYGRLERKSYKTIISEIHNACLSGPKDQTRQQLAEIITGLIHQNFVRQMQFTRWLEEHDEDGMHKKSEKERLQYINQEEARAINYKEKSKLQDEIIQDLSNDIIDQARKDDDPEIWQE